MAGGLVANDRPAPARRRLRLHQGELISVLSAMVLAVLMFAFEWYGLAVTPSPSARRAAVSSTENAWHGLTVLRWLMLLTIAVAVGSVALHASQRTHGVKTDTSRAITALGTVTALLLAYRVLIELPTPREVVDQKLGAYLGLLAAVGIALGGYESIREQRTRARAQRSRKRAASETEAGASETEPPASEPDARASEADAR